MLVTDNQLEKMVSGKKNLPILVRYNISYVVAFLLMLPGLVYSTTQVFKDGVSPNGSYAGTRDTYIHDDQPNTNFGSSTQILLDGSEIPPEDYGTIIKWDVSTIPSGSVVQSASITLKAFNGTGDTYEVYEMKRDWVESEATWNQYASGSNWQATGAQGSQDRGNVVLGTITGSAGYRTITLNSSGVTLVQSWVNNPSSNYGIIIQDYDESDGMDLYSSEYSYASYHPKLTVTYASSGTVYYVRTDGHNSNSGTANTPAGAWKTIRKAATVLSAGDTVKVQPGIYDSNGDHNVNPVNSGSSGFPIVFFADGPGVVIDGGNSSSRCKAFQISNRSYIVIDGFEITNQRDCEGAGGAIKVINSNDITIRNNIFYETGRDAVYLYGTSNNCLIENNLMYTLDDDGITPSGGNHTIRNNTIYDCGVNTGSAGYAVEGANTSGNVYENNIFWHRIDNTGGSVTYAYNDYMHSVLPGTGNISSDPLFVSAAGNDFRLSHTAAGQASNSPCIDAGNLSATTLGLDTRTTRTDQVVDAGTVDMGYHYHVGFSAAGFTNVTSGANLSGKKNQYGVAWGDYNNDGYPDIYITKDNKFYENNGDGTFTYRPGLICGNRAGHWADYDNDGDLDFAATYNMYFSINNYPSTTPRFSLQNNSSIGLTSINNLGDFGWLDYNEDGYLDLWAPNGSNPYTYMYENDGDGTFTGIQGSTIGLTANVNGETTIVGDYDGDGHTDILYRANSVYLWNNDGDGTFTDVTSTAGVSLTGGSGGYNGTAFGDYDNDGDLDLYGGQDGTNRLYRNNGNGTFSDVTSAAGVAGANKKTKGVAWADYDHDGDLDLYVAQYYAANHLFHNNGDGTFTDMASSLHVADNGKSFGVAWADYDLDGDLDLFVGSYNYDSKLFKNNLVNDNYLKVKARGLGAGGSPVDGTGSRVELWNSSGTTLLAIREINGGEGMGSHSPRIAHFGVADSWGGRTGTYVVKVRFTSGILAVVENVVPASESIVIGGTTLNQTIEVREGALVAEWRMDEYEWDGTADEVADSSGNDIHATAQGDATTTQSGQLCNSGIFDGTGDYVITNNNSLLGGMTVISTTLWVNFASLSSNQTLIKKAEDSDTQSPAFVLDYSYNSGKLRFYVYSSNSNYYKEYYSWSPATDTWYHVAIVFNKNASDKIKIFIDGTEITSSEVQVGSFAYIRSVNNPIMLGKNRPGDPQWFHGKMDEVQLYNKALTTNEINDIISATRTCPDYTPPATMAWWAMDEPEWTGASDEVVDSTGNGYHGTAFGGVTTSDGKICKGGLFDGTDDYIDVGHTTTLSNNTFSISVWVNVTNASPRQEMVWGAVTGTSNERFRFEVYDTWINFHDDYGMDTWTSSGTIQPNTWHHVVATYDYPNQKASIYLDGAYKTSDNSFSQAPNTLGVLRIGHRDGWYHLGGSIDEVRIYDQALTAYQVDYLYNQTHPCPDYTVEPIAFWAFDEVSWDGTTDEVEDSSGNDLHGTAQNDVTTASGKICNGGFFDGVDDYVEVGHDTKLDITSNLSLAAWIRPDRVTTWQEFISKGDYSNGAGSLTYFISTSPSAKVRFGINTGLTGDYFESSTTLAVDQWYHVVSTFNPTSNQVKIYLNGTIDNTGSISNNPPSSSEPLFIGALKNSTGILNPFQGIIDEVHIYDQILTGDEVQDLYASTHGCPSYPATPEYEDFPQLDWVLLGVPVDPDTADVLSVLGDDFGGASTVSNYWEVAHWDVTALNYLLYSQSPGTFPDFASGLGFWVFQDVGENLVIDVTGTPVTGDFTVDIIGPPTPAYHGKNMFANPYTSKIDWSDAQITDGSTTLSIIDAALQGWVNANAYTWNVPSQAYELVTPNISLNTDTIGVWEGFWLIQIDYDKNLDLIFQEMGQPRQMVDDRIYVSRYGEEVRKYGRNERSSISDWSGLVYLYTSDGSYRYLDQRFGVHSNAQDGFDGLDGAWLGPGFATTYGALYFEATDNTQLVHDIRDPDWDEKTWPFKVLDVNINGDWVLRWPNLAGIPGSIQMSLESPAGTVVVDDIRTTPSYAFSLSSGEQRDFYLQAVVETDSIPAHARIGFFQNPGVTSHLELYVFPDEPLDLLVLFVDRNSVAVSEVDQLYNTWRSSFEMYEAGEKEVIMHLEDLSENFGIDTLMYNFVLSDGSTPLLVQAPGSGVTVLSIPAGGIPEGSWVGVGMSERCFAEESHTDGAFSSVYSIQPFGLTLPVGSELMLPYPGDESVLSSVQVMRETATGWVPVPADYDPVNRMIYAKVTGSGRYQLQHSLTDEFSGLLPTRTALLANYPNPFNATTVIPYLLTDQGEVTLSIYDLMGREVLTLVNGPQSAGYHRVLWSGLNRDGQPVASGMYVVLLKAKNQVQSHKLMLLK